MITRWGSHFCPAGDASSAVVGTEEPHLQGETLEGGGKLSSEPVSSESLAGPRVGEGHRMSHFRKRNTSSTHLGLTYQY